MRINAKQSGLWNDPNTWITNTVPTIEDEVFCNSFDIYVNDSIACLSISNRQTYEDIEGGKLVLLNDNIAIQADLICNFNSLIDYSFNTLNILGNIYGSNIFGGFGCIENINTGTINLTGNVHGGNFYEGYGLHNLGNGNIIIQGQLFLGGGGFAFAVYNKMGNIIINGQEYPYQGGL